jgi:hypothetical protein
VHLSCYCPTAIAVTPDLIIKFGGGSLNSLVIPYSEPSVLVVRWIFVHRPSEIIWTIPEGMLGRFPRFRNILRPFRFWQVWVDCAYVVVQESQRGIVYNIRGHRTIGWVVKFSGNELRDCIVINPDLEIDCDMLAHSGTDLTYFAEEGRKHTMSSSILT